MPQLVLSRHGESLWNRDNRFTGWTDIDLSPDGLGEARRAATLIAGDGIAFDLCLTSMQKRAIRTLWIVLDELDLMYVQVERHRRLNERRYGTLQGQNKNEKRLEVGEAQVHEWHHP
jgi:2,3-bisphosphoglycerate-dependent phosphoglycerate mutase